MRDGEDKDLEASPWFPSRNSLRATIIPISGGKTLDGSYLTLLRLLPNNSPEVKCSIKLLEEWGTNWCFYQKYL